MHVGICMFACVFAWLLNSGFSLRSFKAFSILPGKFLVVSSVISTLEKRLLLQKAATSFIVLCELVRYAFLVFEMVPIQRCFRYLWWCIMPSIDTKKMPVCVHA